MSIHRGWIALLGAALLVMAAQSTAFAHPMGNFSINRYTRLEVTPDGVRARYVLDLAEIPTLQELRADGVTSGGPGPAEHEAILRAKTAELVHGARLSIDGRPMPWTVDSAALEMIPGQADLDTMRVELDLFAPQQAREGMALEYHDENYAGRVGWHEIVALGAGGFGLQGSTVPTTDQTDELRNYPLDPSAPPLDVSSAQAGIVVGESTMGASPQAPVGVTGPRFAIDPRTDYLASLLRGGGVGPFALIAALVAAVGLGGLHALEPGHGKTIVGGFLVGSRGTPRQAVLLGLTVTATHTIGVYLLGIVTLVGAQFIVPERLYPILGIFSGLCVVGIGLSLVSTRARGLFSTLRDRQGHHAALLSLSLAPSYTSAQHHQAMLAPALAVPYPARIHHHSHDQGHGDHEHAHGPDGSHSHAGSDGHHVHARDDAPKLIAHRHGIGPLHTHRIGDTDGGPVSGRRLLTLGISGGLLPCPSALVVLLAAISLGNIGLGMALVAAFSLGLAAVLTSLGLAAVYGGRALGRVPLFAKGANPIISNGFPIASAVIVTVAGIGITLQAVSTWA